MKSKLLLAVLGACALLAGCLPSVFPLFTDKELVFERALAGEWREDGDKKDTWTFEAADDGKEDRNYKLIHTDEDGRSAEFVAQLGRLKGKLFLDLAVKDLREAKDKLNGLASVSLIQGHLFFRVWQIEPELKLNTYNSDRLIEMLEQDPKLLAHRGNKRDGVVLLASTAELQAFFSKHADDKELFGGNDGEGLKRRTPKAEKKP